MHGDRLPKLARVIIRRVEKGGATLGQSELCNGHASAAVAAALTGGVPGHDMRQRD